MNLSQETATFYEIYPEESDSNKGERFPLELDLLVVSEQPICLMRKKNLGSQKLSVNSALLRVGVGGIIQFSLVQKWKNQELSAGTWGICFTQGSEAQGAGSAAGCLVLTCGPQYLPTMSLGANDFTILCLRLLTCKRDESMVPTS